MCEPAAKPRQQHAAPSQQTSPLQLPDHHQNEPQHNRRPRAAPRSHSNSRTYWYRSVPHNPWRRPKTPRHVEAGDKQRMHGRPASWQPSPNRAIVVIVGRGGESSPNPPLTRVGPKALPGSEATSLRLRTLTAAASCDTVSSILWMSRCGPLYPRSRSTPASRP